MVMTKIDSAAAWSISLPPTPLPAHFSNRRSPLPPRSHLRYLASPGQNTDHPIRELNSSSAAIPARELPAAFSSGDYTHTVN